jgi:peptidoglycan hydrolase-like amidase
VLLPEDLAPLSMQAIRLSVTYPHEPGTYTLSIGEVKYTLEVSGRRARAEQQVSRRNDQLQVAGCKDAICNLQPFDSAQDKPATLIRIRLSTREANALSCDAVDLQKLKTQYRGTLECTVIDGRAAIINSISLEDYLAGLAEEPDAEPYEKQRAFAIAARTYAAYYMQEKYRKFPGMPYDGDDSPARFQSYKGITFELKNPRWVKAVRSTTDNVLMIGDALIKPPYFSSDDGRTRSPEEAGWKNFPHAEIFKTKPDPWCKGMPMAGHGVGMSGCGAKGQANEGKTAEQILQYYYPKTTIVDAPSSGT